MERAADLISRGMMLLCIAVFAVMVFSVSYGVVGRYISFIHNPRWTQELAILCMVWLCFLGAGYAIKEGLHVRMTIINFLVPEKAGKVLHMLAYVLLLAVNVFWVVYGMQLVIATGTARMAATGWPLSLTYLSVVIGGISGSATADTASLGAILIPMMRKQGYDDEFSAAVTMTSSVQGMLIPPSHNMIIYAMAAGGLSVSALFMAGIVPGVLLGVALMIFSFYLSVKRNYPKGNPFSLRTLIKAVGKSIWGLGTVLIVVVGVVAGVFTATESAAIACLYALVVSMLVYRELSWKQLLNVLKSSIKTLSTVLILIAASGPFGFCITYLKIPALVVDGLLSLTDSKFVLLLLINLVILLLGMILGMASIIVIATPIILPILLSIGVSPIQFGVMLILNCGIGLITPPVGGVLFIGSGLTGKSIEQLTKHTFPFLIVMLIVLLLITYIPALSLALPQALGLL